MMDTIVTLPDTPPPPSYPPYAHRQGYEGRVIIQVSISPSGKVEQAVVSRSSGYRGLDKAASKAIENWRFHPARQVGRLVQATLQAPIVFRLQSQ